MHAVRVVASFLFVILIAWSRVEAADPNPWRSHQAVVDAFYAKSVKDRIETFSRYSFDEQYAIYLYGNQIQHPPALYLADPFAAEGKGVVDALAKRLAGTSDDLTIRDLVIVFAAMNRQKTYDVRGDGRLRKLVTESVQRMKDPDWKRIVAKEISDFAESDAEAGSAPK
jgi:hypothetical protein